MGLLGLAVQFAVFTFIVVAVCRRFGAIAAWAVWFFISTIFAVRAVTSSIPAIGPAASTPGVWLYIVLVSGSMPAGFLTMGVIRAWSRDQGLSFWRHIRAGLKWFLLALPLGIFLGLVPDLVRYVQ